MAEDLERCPDCGTDLEEYWSDERVDEYFQSAMRRSGSWLIVGRLEGGELVGWTWGYDSCEVADLPEVGGTCTYVDVVGVMPEHRGSWAVVFFRRAHELLIDAGFSCLVTRTHKTARNVHLVMRVTGWERLDEASLADTEREFWIRRSEAT